MRSVEQYFNDTIEKYSQLKQATLTLVEAIHGLSPIEIENRCNALTTLQRELAVDNDQLNLLMEDIGPEILNNSYLGEYQRAMDKSILAYDTLQAAMHIYRNRICVLS
ncbi:MAG: hypothetical protein JZU65_16300 [Chlorobium sp.]|nr:hypothetical protein [Chlorobium sp.]